MNSFKMTHVPTTSELSRQIDDIRQQKRIKRMERFQERLSGFMVGDIEIDINQWWNRTFQTESEDVGIARGLRYAVQFLDLIDDEHTLTARRELAAMLEKWSRGELT